MPITLTHFIHDSTDNGWFSAVILQPTRSKGEFRRCGIITGRPPTKRHGSLYDAVVHFFSKPDRKPDDWFEYEEFDGKDRYTISII